MTDFSTFIGVEISAKKKLEVMVVLCLKGNITVRIYQLNCGLSFELFIRHPFQSRLCHNSFFEVNAVINHVC